MEVSRAASVSDSVRSAYASAPGGRSRRRRRAAGGLRRRCYAALKQQKTRFYILGRCVSMLLCWHDHDPSD